MVRLFCIEVGSGGGERVRGQRCGEFGGTPTALVAFESGGDRACWVFMYDLDNPDFFKCETHDLRFGLAKVMS
jgi:hypothetical protein